MAIRFIEIFVLKECRRRQNDVRIISSVSEELLMDYRKQIRTHKASDHIIVVRRDDCRI